MDQTWYNLIRLNQNGSNLIKLDQLDQIGSNLIKLDQTWSNWIKLDLNGSNLIKLDQTWSKWIKLIKLDQYHISQIFTCTYRCCQGLLIFQTHFRQFWQLSFLSLHIDISRSISIEVTWHHENFQSISCMFSCLCQHKWNN